MHLICDLVLLIIRLVIFLLLTLYIVILPPLANLQGYSGILIVQTRVRF